MKKTITYLLGALLLIACGGDDAGGNTPSGGSEYLNVNNNNTRLDISGDNMQATLSIQASPNCEWTITWDNSASWIQRISPTTGRGSQVVEIRVSTNPSSVDSREALLTIRNANGNITRNVNLVQSASNETLELSVYELNLTYEKGSQEVRITSNSKWSVTGMTDWLTVSPTSSDGDDKVTINVLENTTEQSRNASLTFTGSGGTHKQIAVLQAGRPTDFTVSPTSLTAEAQASTIQFSITGEARWTVKTDKDWARPSDVKGEGSKTITVTLDDNVREEQQIAVITVSSATNASKFEQVTITQKAATRPVISSQTYTDVTRTEATVSFNFTSMYPVTEYGVCYSTDENPTVNSPHTTELKSATQGSYSTRLTGLSAGITYHLRAYAISKVATAYSEEIMFTTEQGETPNPGDNPQPGW